MLGVGVYYLKKNASSDDYYVGGRNIGSTHIGLSVVATDVGGGFSIGLGGLGFMIGISGSWMLFTGLVGAWLSAVVLIPKVSKLSKIKNLLTFPQIFEHFYDKRVALIAGIISALGYLGFTSSQILAGAKLASATFVDLDQHTALFIMGLVAVVYTVMGGLKAVIYTDTIQWIILMSGLLFIGIPISYTALGGYDAIRANLPEGFLQFNNLTWQDIVNWSVTIVPIWFVGMTLYQRIFACKNEQEAKKAWFLAGLFEWPIMAFLGVILGLFSRVAVQQGLFESLGYSDISNFDPEMGIPLLLNQLLPIGLLGLMMSAYFSAIMSTADSCLMAASGNIVTDIIGNLRSKKLSNRLELRFSQIITLCVGLFAIVLASYMVNVLELMLYSYAFMVSGLFVPVIGAVVFGNRSALAALSAMIVGGTTTLLLILSDAQLPYNLDPNVFGILSSLFAFTGVSFFDKKNNNPQFS